MNFLKVHVLLTETECCKTPTYFRKDRVISFGYHPLDDINYIEIIPNKGDGDTRIPIKEDPHEILIQLEGH